METRPNVKSKTIALRQGPKGLRLQVRESRQVSRNTAFSRCRNLDISTDSNPETNEIGSSLNAVGPLSIPDVKAPATTPTISVNRRMLLENWKKGKKEEKLRQQEQQKPVFKTGVVQHSLNPWSLIQSLPPVSKTVKPQKKVSPLKVAVAAAGSRRGATTRTMAKSAATVAPPVVMKAVPKTSRFNAPKGLKPVVLTVPLTPKIAQSKKVTMTSKLKHQVLTKPKHQEVTKPKHQELTKPKHQELAKSRPQALIKPNVPNPPQVAFSAIASLPTALVRSINVGAKLNRTAETIESNEVASTSPPQQSSQQPFSPYVTVRRGNYSERRKSQIASVSTVTQEEVDATAAAGVPATTTLNEPQEKGAVYFRNLLDSEIARLSSVADEWEAIRASLSPDVAEDVASLVDLATCQTRLLIRSKFQQFRGLTYECEAGTSVPPVRPDDLQGFWEMIYMQVEGLDKQYAKLGDLRANDWTEKVNPAQKKKKAVTAAPIAKRVAPANNVRSGMRAMIEAARKKKLEAEKVEAKFNASADSLEGDARMPEIKSTPANSSKRISLLQQVLSTGAAKRLAHSSPIMMKVSQYAKAVGSPVAANDGTPRVVAKAGSTPFKAGSTPFKAGSTPFKAGSTPFKAGSTPFKAGSTPFKAGATPFKAGATPFKAGSTPFKAGSTPLKAGPTPSSARFRAGSTPFKSILKDSSTSGSAMRVTRKTVNFGGTLRKSLLPELTEPEHVGTAAAETFAMLPPASASVTAPSAGSILGRRSMSHAVPSTTSVRRGGRQSMLERIGVKDKLQQQRGKSKNVVPEKENAVRFAIADISMNTKKRKSVSEPVDIENTQDKEQRRSYRSKPDASAEQESEDKRKSLSTLVDVDNTPDTGRRSYRKTPARKAVQTDSEDKRKSLSTLVDVDNTPDTGRRSYRKTPAHKAVQTACVSPASSTTTSKRQSLPALIDVENSPSKQRRSYRKTPHKAVHQVDRVSLFGGMEELEQVTSPPPTGDLISFHTPVRRSTRLSRK